MSLLALQCLPERETLLLHQAHALLLSSKENAGIIERTAILDDTHPLRNSHLVDLFLERAADRRDTGIGSCIDRMMVVGAFPHTAIQPDGFVTHGWVSSP